MSFYCVKVFNCFIKFEFPVKFLFQILGHYMAPDAQDPDVPDAQDVRNAINDVMQDLQVN